MRTENRHFRSRIGSVVIEAAIAVSLFMVLICAAISSVTAVNAELYMQRASENVVSELNVVIPLASNGISCADDLVSAFGVADNVSFDTDQLDDALGVIGSASGVTGVDLEDLVGTALFGRYVRDRIVEEYYSLVNSEWVYEDIVQDVSVYLDYESADKSIYVSVYYDIVAGKVRLPRSYCTSIALYADAIPLRSTENEEKKDSEGSVWDLENFERGQAIREQFGGNLPYNFPVIAYSTENEVVSIKSMDTTSPYYEERPNVRKKLKSYIKDLEGFNGADQSGISVQMTPSTRKTLLLIIPENGSESSRQYISEMEEYAAERGIGLKVEEYEKSNHYNDSGNPDS